MDDVTPRLLKNIKDEFQNLFDGNKKIASLYARVRDGTATYVEANEFAVEIGEILANTFAKTLSSDVLPDGKMYYNIANRIIPEMMQNNHKLITDVTKQVQGALNSQAKIRIKPITPDVNTDRIKGIVNKVSDAEKYDDVAWVLNEPIINFSQSIVDDSIRANAEFQYGAGLSPKIIRTSTGKCCDWCNRVAGVHDYEKVRNTGNNVFRRHRYCRCMVVFDPGDGKGKVQNVHSKKWKRQDVTDAYIERAKSSSNDEKKAVRKNVGLKNYDGDKKQRIEKSKQITSKDLDGMSLKELRDLAEKTAVDFYKSGLSGVNFGNRNPENVVKTLVKSGSRSSLKKDIISMQKKLEKTNKSDRIKLEDTIIHKSVGAKFKNYDVLDPTTGEMFQFSEGTRIQNSEVFAGKGTRKPLHEGVAEGLTEQIGGKVENWQHCKGNGVIDYYGEERPAEVHWFQEESVGKVKFKVKEWLDEG